jgi:hypothetical protein
VRISRRNFTSGVIRTLRYLLLLPACGLAFNWTEGQLPPAGDAGQDNAIVVRSPEFRETTFEILSGECRISWTVYESDANRGVIRHRSDCGLSLGEQAALTSKLLRKVTQSGTDATRFRTLSWGRLYPDGAQDAALSARLALAAKRSADWDPVRGTPQSGDINGWVRKLANEALIYAELRPVFREFGLDIHLASVEKVLVFKAKLLPFFDMLREAGVQPDDRLPFDCQAWFSVRQHKDLSSSPP